MFPGGSKIDGQMDRRIRVNGYGDVGYNGSGMVRPVKHDGFSFFALLSMS